MASTIILGAGITGLCAGYQRKRDVYEASDCVGGICASYYVAPSQKRLEGVYRFEKGGGHWIFGKDEALLSKVQSFSWIKSYKRRASVYFPDKDLYVPYPLQNHLYLLPQSIRKKIENEISSPLLNEPPIILKDWLIYNFGKTLSNLFFIPFHDLYTAGLTDKITIQDLFKSPSDRSTMLRGLKRKTAPVGYNTTFVYPQKGLDHLMKQIEQGCKVHYYKRAVRVDVKRKTVYFQDNTKISYSRLISTIPLSEIVKLSQLKRIPPSDPYTSVLVLNIGAKKGKKCPADHWVYVPQSKNGFHRIGFYSNVDSSFLPKNRHKDLVSIYVEKSFLPYKKPQSIELERLKTGIIKELQDWGYIKEVEVVSPTWIEHAYTWQLPNSEWKEKAISYLSGHAVDSIGRYGAWKFQGILDSMRDGYLS